MKIVDAIVLILLIIGGINMAIVGILHFDVIALIFGETWRLTVAYIVIALAAIYFIFRYKDIFFSGDNSMKK
jgi:uncharacterized membrane protein YuzA (DUF378 family)